MPTLSVKRRATTVGSAMTFRASSARALPQSRLFAPCRAVSRSSGASPRRSSLGHRSTGAKGSRRRYASKTTAACARVLSPDWALFSCLLHEREGPVCVEPRWIVHRYRTVGGPHSAGPLSRHVGLPSCRSLAESRHAPLSDLTKATRTVASSRRSVRRRLLLLREGALTPVEVTAFGEDELDRLH